MVVGHKYLALTLDNTSEEEGELYGESKVRCAAVLSNGGEIFVKELDRERRGRSRERVEGFGG